MAKKLDIVLHSDYPPQTCLAKLAEQIDLDERTLFSFSGYKGKKPILGGIAGDEFRLHKRRYWHNSFGPVLFGRMIPDGRGTLVEAYWEVWKAVRIFMRIWLGLAILICTPAFLVVLKCAINPRCADRENLWVGLIVPPALILWGFLLPRLGSALGFHERKHVVQLLERTLVAGPATVEKRERSWNSTLDGFSLWRA
jgi:hypothetical protein